LFVREFVTTTKRTTQQYLSQLAAKLDLLLCESDTSDVQYISSRYQHVEDDYLQREILKPSVIVVCTWWVTALFVDSF